MTDVLDAKVLDELRASVGGDQEFVGELIDELLADAPRQLQALRDAALSGDAEGARRAAHTLKGNGRTFGAADLSALGLELETSAAAGDLDSVIAKLDAIDEAWTRTQTALVVERGSTS